MGPSVTRWAARVALSTLRRVLGMVDGVEDLSVVYRGVWLGIPMHFTGGVVAPPEDSRTPVGRGAGLGPCDSRFPDSR
ncbi:hypothetical protein [Streptomyces anulatus]|uniref:hypothetical protein n=1 Tax=Streptomyces anulatus TaxID=1892 RepID=UPI0034397CDC